MKHYNSKSINEMLDLNEEEKENKLNGMDVIELSAWAISCLDALIHDETLMTAYMYIELLEHVKEVNLIILTQSVNNKTWVKG